MRRQRKLRGPPAAARPADRPAGRFADPAVVDLERRPVAVEVVVLQGALDQEMVEHQVVQGEHPGHLEGPLPDLVVPGVVAHLVEGEAAPLPRFLELDHRIGVADRRVDRLPRDVHQPQVAALRQMRQEVGAIVGDARSAPAARAIPGRSEAASPFLRCRRRRPSPGAAIWPLR